MTHVVVVMTEDRAVHPRHAALGGYAAQAMTFEDAWELADDMNAAHRAVVEAVPGSRRTLWFQVKEVARG